MKTSIFDGVRAALILLMAAIALPAKAEKFQLVSALDASQVPAVGGNGDSLTPVISADGRFVLFASSANNLLLQTNGNPIPALGLQIFNVFVRDLTNGTTALVSVNATGSGGGNGNSLPHDISADGHYALFASSASDLVPGDTNGVADVFMRDLLSGVTWLVSTNSNGGIANGMSRSPVMTRDARYVAFVSAATNLVADDTNGIPDVFLRDMQAGATILISVGATSTNTGSPSGSSENPEISADGRYVAFQSTATNLVSGVTTTGDIYVRDTILGLTTMASDAARVSLGTPNAFSYNHTISADGNFVAFEVSTNQPDPDYARGMILRFNLATGVTQIVNTNAHRATAAFDANHSLVMTPDGRFIAFVGNTNGTLGTSTAIYLWDSQSATTKLVSGDLSNQVSPGSISDWPTMDEGGRYIAFLSSSTNLVTNSLVGDFHLYMRDTQAGTTRLVAVDTNGLGAPLSPATVSTLSSNGQFVAFESSDTSLFPNDRNRDYDVLVKDLSSEQIQLVSARHPSLPSLSPNGSSYFSSSAISFNGDYVALASEADNLVAGDTNGCRDIFVRNRRFGTNIMVSVATNGSASDGPSTEPSISGDGQLVAFTSRADNLVVGDTNNSPDVFVRDSVTGQTRLVSVDTNGTGPGNNASSTPIISTDGKFVLFRSKASNLASGSFSIGSENLFLRNLQANVTEALTTNGIITAAMTPNGRYVALVDGNSRFYVRDSQTSALIFSNSTTVSAPRLALSADGRWLAFATNQQLRAMDLIAGTNVAIFSGSFPLRAGLQFSGDGRSLVYIASSPPSITNQVYLYDFSTAKNLLISHTLASSAGAISNSDSPTISADGRFIGYRSLAPDIVVGDTNMAADVLLYDRLAGSTTLISASRFANVASDNRSLTPVFTADGQTLIFESWASDLSGLDYNHNSDLFAYTLLVASIAPVSAPGQGVVISWPAVSGTTYRVEYKNTVGEAVWQTLSGTVTHAGTRAYLSDAAAVAGQRFYRVVAF